MIINKLKEFRNGIESLFFNVKSIDTQIEFPRDKWEKLSSKDIVDHIREYSSVDTIKHSFFHSTYAQQILCYLQKPLTFLDCTFDVIIGEYEDLYLFTMHTFKNCTAYITFCSNEKSKNDFFKNEINKIRSLHKNSLKIVTHPYSLKLLNSKAKKRNFDMLHINNLDLQKTSLPSNPSFFKNLASDVIKNTKLPKINLNDYDLGDIRFSSCEFHKNTIMPYRLLLGRVHNCVLPPIIFNSSKRYLIDSCTIHNDSIFPDNDDFFLYSTFKSCILPKKDYSFYKIDKTSFQGCTFNEKSILPRELFEQKNYDILSKIQGLPKKDIGNISRYLDIHDKKSFISKYNSDLSIEDRFVLYNL